MKFIGGGVGSERESECGHWSAACHVSSEDATYLLFVATATTTKWQSCDVEVGFILEACSWGETETQVVEYLM